MRLTTSLIQCLIQAGHPFLHDKKCISRLTNKSKHAMNTAEYTNKNCILTEYTNFYCGYDKDRPFYDYVRMLKLYKINSNIQWILIFSLIFYDIYLLMN